MSTPRAAGTPRVKLRRAGSTPYGLPVYRAFVDGVEVARVDGSNAAPSNPWRATAWVVYLPTGLSRVEDRLASVRIGLDRDADQLLELLGRNS